MKVSEITVNNVSDYLRLIPGECSDMELEVYLTAAKDYISSFKGLDADEIDTHGEFVPVVYILCQDMHDNRSMYVEEANLNKVVESILGMHSTNLL